MRVTHLVRYNYVLAKETTVANTLLVTSQKITAKRSLNTQKAAFSKVSTTVSVRSTTGNITSTTSGMRSASLTQEPSTDQPSSTASLTSQKVKMSTLSITRNQCKNQHERSGFSTSVLICLLIVSNLLCSTLTS